ncbi:hypothetical protein IU507_16995 [Nocardia cyriacigeorgica]|nr:hypothetical protein [Nocardia cyriacigeorgica]
MVFTGFAVAPAAAAVHQVAAPTGMTSGRLGPTLTALVGLVGVIAGGLALARARRGEAGSRAGAIALTTGVIVVPAGAWFAATADGGPGTGNGIVGAWIAIALGLIGAALGGVSLARARGTAGTAP